MNRSILKKFAVAAGAVMTFAVGQAVAAPVFGLTQSAIGGTFLGPSAVTGTQFTGNSSELLHFSPTLTTVVVNSGFLTIGSVFNSNTATTTLINSNSGTGTYGLYVTFSFTSQYDAAASTGPAGSAGSVYDITSLNFSFFADPLGNTTFTTAASPTTEAGVSGGSGDDILLAFGAIVPSGNVAGFNQGGGAFLNSLETFSICSGVGTAKTGSTVSAAAQCTSATGTSYFSSPVPFYPLAFDAFNNTGNSLGAFDATTRTLAITQAAGVVSFQAVPEPSTVALFGIAALGMGLSARRRRNKA